MDLSVELDQAALDNGTTLAITTQICLNNGVCDPPVAQEATVSDDGSTYTMELEPPSDHSYVNWRIKATYADESTENFPDGAWYKTWSSCYYQEKATVVFTPMVMGAMFLPLAKVKVSFLRLVSGGDGDDHRSSGRRCCTTALNHPRR